MVFWLPVEYGVEGNRPRPFGDCSFSSVGACSLLVGLDNFLDVDVRVLFLWFRRQSHGRLASVIPHLGMRRVRTLNTHSDQSCNLRIF